MSNFFNPIWLPTANLFNNLTVAVSTISSPSARLPTFKDSKLHVYVENTGTSGNVTVTLYSTDSLTSTKRGVIKELELGATGSGFESEWIYLDTPEVPAYVYVQATNKSSSNPAIISVTVDRYR